MERSVLRIAGVPEHFNVPWHMALASGEGAVEWRDYPGGTGAMCRALVAKEVDLAVLLTEGAIKHIAGGGGARIIGSYTRSPLVWGVHVAASGGIEEMSQLCGARYAISREGSGSQLMAQLDAAQRGWPAPECVPCGDLEGGRAALAEDRADAFMWEKTMSLPLVQSGEWRRIGEFAGPWPAFVIMAREGHLDAPVLPWLSPLLERVSGACERAERERERTVAFIGDRYGIPTPDVLRWLDETRWDCRPGVSRGMLEATVEVLFNAGILSSRLSYNDLVAPEFFVTV